MDLIYVRDKDIGADCGILHNYEIDFEISEEKCDFELKMDLSSRDDLLYIEGEVGSIIYIEDSEFGGQITGAEIDIGEQTVTYRGLTWRGMLDNYIIEPPYGSDYLTVSGDLAYILYSKVPHYSAMRFRGSGYNVRSYSFDRYITSRVGIDKILASRNKNLRMRIQYEVDQGSALGLVVAYIEPKRDLRDTILLSQDYDDKIKLKIKRDENLPRRLICLGKGELSAREVINLYVDENWNVTDKPFYNSYPTAVYDNSSSDNLKEESIKHYKDLIVNHEQIEIVIDDMRLDLGDIIAAKDNITGESVSAEITGVILKKVDNAFNHSEDFEYKTKVRV